ncbi:hypothetical protein HPP92_027559 [Vanilla planifolia]|uniref:Uncharacterized protein n=1 Tax=Vanilla planifolia TaxID=51239 RepID=A0A835PAT7_VANPL|nr:hypothetical protein HPP92_027559 [Vanilla planifolia]
MYSDFGNFDPPPHDSNDQMPISMVDSCNSNDCLVEQCKVPSFGLHHSDEAAMSLDHLNRHLGLDTLPPPTPLDPGNWDVGYTWESGGQQPTPPQTMYPVPDLLNLLELPQCAVAPSAFPPTSAISLDGISMLYDPLVDPVNPAAAAQTGVLRDLFSPLPQSYGLFCGLDEREAWMGGEGGGMLHEIGGRRQFDGGAMDYRRAAMKTDRASIVGDAIDYIKELLRTVEELKLLVERKRCGRERKRRRRAEEEASGDMESSTIRLSKDDDHERPVNGPLRSSWLQRRSKETFVDVRIIDDEVNIKLTQKKKGDALLSAAKAVDDLRLHLVHLAGGILGITTSLCSTPRLNNFMRLNPFMKLNPNRSFMGFFWFLVQISEGSSVYAGAVASKLLEAMSKQHMALQFSNNGY